ncbi:MAG: hypothetical protein OEX82_06680, partial [Nitrosomonas sp.]|nr:hypothetical protein [Nitrosomonas sp.]
PRARIRVFVWFIVFIRNYYIPAWILACWYIGWDTWDMLTTDEQGGVNLVAHVSGGIGGYLIGLFWLKSQRDDAKDDLEEEIEYMRARRDIGGTMSTYKGGRRELQNIQREKQSQREHDDFMAELYRYVKTERDSDAIALMISDYEFQSASVEIFEQLFERSKEWGASRALLCLGRLLINLLIEQRKYARALMYIEQCQQVTPAFLLADPANVLLMASMARDNHQYEVAYQLVRESETRYGESVDLAETSLIEVELLWQHLNQQETAKDRMKQLLRVAGVASNKQFMGLAKEMI